MPKDIPLDPWGHPFVYKFPGPNPNEPGILSHGIDADIVSWKN
jgi:general secretion pathway protein G